MTAWRVELAPRAARSFERLPADQRDRVRAAILRLAASGGASRGGKAVKTISGRRDAFHRLRVGDLRVMYDLIADDHVILVLGIVDRRDLERWIRDR